MLGAAKGVRQKEFDHFFFVFGTLSVTFRSLFLMLLSLFSSLFCQTPFAGLLLRQGDVCLCHRTMRKTNEEKNKAKRRQKNMYRNFPPTPSAPTPSRTSRLVDSSFQNAPLQIVHGAHAGVSEASAL